MLDGAKLISAKATTTPPPAAPATPPKPLTKQDAASSPAAEPERAARADTPAGGADALDRRTPADEVLRRVGEAAVAGAAAGVGRLAGGEKQPSDAAARPVVDGDTQPASPDDGGTKSARKGRTGDGQGVEPAPPGGGGGTQQQPVDAPPGSAAALDQEVPLAEREARIAADEAARAEAERVGQQAERTGDDGTQVERAQLADYYEQNPTYVDEATGRVYAVTYDEATGVLTGTRTSDAPISAPGHEDEGSAADDVGGIGGIADATRDLIDSVGHAVGGAKGDARPTTGNLTTQLEVLPDGSVVARQQGPATLDTASGGELAGTQQRRFDYGDDGEFRGGSVRNSGSAPHAGNGTEVVEELTSYAADGSYTERGTDTRTRSDGSRYVDATSADYRADGTVSHEEVRTSAEENGVTATEVHTTEFDAEGEPATGEINRTLEVPYFGPFASTREQNDSLTYGPDGQVVAIESDYDEADRGALNDTLAVIAPDSDSRAHFSFGIVEKRPEEAFDEEGDPVYEDDGSRAYEPAVISGPGATLEHEGIRVVVEGADASVEYPQGAAPADPAEATGTSGTDQEHFDAIRAQLDALPPQLEGTVKQVRYIFHPGVDTSGAGAWATGDKELVFPYGVSSQATLFHEAAHAADGPEGSREGEAREAYAEAAEADEATRDEVLATIPEGAVVRGARSDVANGGIGVTGYGNDTIADDDTYTEDWADATALYLASQRDGGILHVTNPDGTERWITFEELYPERAAILDEYYDGFEGWEPGTPQFADVPVDAYPDPEEPEPAPAPAPDPVDPKDPGSKQQGGG